MCYKISRLTGCHTVYSRSHSCSHSCVSSSFVFALLFMIDRYFLINALCHRLAWRSWCGDRFGDYSCVDCASLPCTTGGNQFINTEFTLSIIKISKSCHCHHSFHRTFRTIPLAMLLLTGHLSARVYNATSARVAMFV